MQQETNQAENNNWKLISYLKRFWVSSTIAHFSVSDYKRIFPFLSLSVSVGLFVAIVYSRATEVNEFVVNRITAQQQGGPAFVIDPIHQLNYQPENKEDEDEQNFVSYCSHKADRRGLNQNVIAYSLYGNFSNENHFTRYADPLKIILSNISQVYPGEVITC